MSDQRPPVLTKAAKKSVSKPAKKVAGAAIGEGVDDNKKRGRPEKWTPRVMEPADFVRASELRKKYGPDMEPLARFAKKYEIFCALNKIEKSDGIFLAMGQASEMGAAASSMNTQFGGMLKQRLFACANSWEARETLERHHADANPVQPRSFVGTQENLSALVEKMDVIMTKALAWMCFVTGARAINITRLRYSQTILMKSALLLQRRWSQVCRTRSKRDTLSYKYAWSMPPPEDVVSFFDKGKNTPDGYPFLALQGKKGSTALTSALRKTSGSETITSYVFRDYMDERLVDSELDESEIVRLMEHSTDTSRASYKSDAITRSQAEAANAKRPQTKKASRAMKKAARKNAIPKMVKKKVKKGM